MIAPILRSKLEPIVATYRRFQLWRALTLCWCGAASLGVLLILLRGVLGMNGSAVTFILLGFAAVAGIATWISNRRRAIDFHWVAEQIEVENPRLHTLLLAAVEQEPDPATGRLNYLQERVINEAVEENRRHPWHQKFSEKLLFARVAQVVSLIVFLVLLSSIGTPPAGKGWFRLSGSVTITPGDASVERGSGVVVLARFEGKLPAEVALVGSSATQPNQRITLTKNLDDPVFGGSIPEVNSETVYHIEHDGQRTRDFKLTVFEYPRLERADAELTFPEFTALPPKKFDDIHRLSAVEGTLLEYTFLLNKPVRSARLQGKDRAEVALVMDEGRSNVFHAKLTLEQSQRYDLELVDDAGRTNKTPAEFVIDVLKNRAPELKLAFPRGDPKVSPIEELTFQAETWDDFGVKAVGLAYSIGGGEPKFIELGKAAAANEKQQIHHLLSLEELGVKPDEMIAYFVWADDIGPDGIIRRASSDMYFAEVRPFEEIFREGQAGEQPPGESQQGSPATKLGELQKQIINATWKLKRREPPAKPSARYQKDAEVVLQSQQKALEQLEVLRERLAERPQAVETLDRIEKEMNKAVEHLTEAESKNVVPPLTPALSAEQAAYQALLKLDAHEFNIMRSRSQNQGRNSESMDRQLQELDLKQSENRYETQRQAESQATPEQKEQQEVLNRLKDLAQRQQDVNQRLKELQTALQEAKNENERDEIKRQLKRLREEQQEIVRDMDELRQRMARSENQAQMAEARDQLEKTRSQAMQAEEQLDKEAVSQALSAGTRTQRDLENLRDDFRKRTSNQFSEDLRQMRNDARELAQKEEDIAKKLQESNQSKKKTLSDSEERKELASKFEQQKAGLTNLLQNVRRVSEQAEVAEPVVSKQLYETLRKTDQANIDNALQTSAELLRRGFAPQAASTEQKARAGIDDLKRGVEQAAESILGDEAEALRQAKRELENLASQLEKEMAQAQPGGAGQQRENQPGNAAPRDGAEQQRSAQGQSGQQLAQADQRGEASQQNRQGEGNQNADAAEQNQSSQGQQQQQQAREGSQGQQRGQRGQGRGNNSEQQIARADQQQQGEVQQGQQREGNQNPQQVQRGQQPGQQQGQGQQPGQQGQQPGQGQPGPGQQGQNPQTGQGQQNQLAEGERQQQGQREGGAAMRRAFFDRPADSGPEQEGPITGRDFRNWSDRLSNVEEMLDQPELRNELARVRDRARAIRTDFKRHSKPPQWDLVRAEILKPMVEVRSRVMEELAKRESNEALVPIDRDPVPPKFAEKVRKYYRAVGQERMILAALFISGRDWWVPAAVLFGAAIILLFWSYRHSSSGVGGRFVCAFLKLVGLAALGFCLLEPLWSTQRARPGANFFAVVADNSQGMQIKDLGATRSRGEVLRELLTSEKTTWQEKLDDLFQVRRYLFDSRLQSSKDFGDLQFDGRASAIGTALRLIADRYQGQPLAGVLLFTDGNATDLADASALSGLPPVYPVVIGNDHTIKDITVQKVSVSQTAFEDAPVTVEATVLANGYTGSAVVAQLFELTDGKGTNGSRVRPPLESSGGPAPTNILPSARSVSNGVALTEKIANEQTGEAPREGEPMNFRFQVRPTKAGISFYRLRVSARDELEQFENEKLSTEATLANNSRMVVVDRGRGPYRVLYVAGRPNWEFKYLNRALAEDDQVRLTALFRIAKREPKFQFKGRAGESSNPLFRGFDKQGDDTERYDQPVLKVLTWNEGPELQGGFPKTAEELYGYHAVIIAKLESEFFTHEQMVLLEKFVSERGGGFLMLGGMESFHQGKYERTPIADLLPVYLDRVPASKPLKDLKLGFTREGWLQPWARLRSNEEDERARLNAMPPLQVLNRVRDIKPGASVLAAVTDSERKEYPALIVQRFGRGRSAALTIGDLWSGGFSEDPGMMRDLEKFWRQMTRWLVADVPNRVELQTEQKASDQNQSVVLQVRARDKKFQPLENATVKLNVHFVGTQPAKSSGSTNASAQLAGSGHARTGKDVPLAVDPALSEAGLYQSAYIPRETGGYLAEAIVTDSAGIEVGQAEAGWTADPAADEFRSLKPNRALLDAIAKKTGGEVISVSKLAEFANRLPNRKVPITESTSFPLWHTPLMFLLALGCFIAEWGLRRWKGLA